MMRRERQSVLLYLFYLPHYDFRVFKIATEIMAQVSTHLKQGRTGTVVSAIGLWAEGSLVLASAMSPFIVAISRSHFHSI